MDRKLDFSGVKLYGRSRELSILQEAYQRVSEDKSNPCQVALVHGIAGTGKSRLIQQLRNWIQDQQQEKSGYIVSGKFDQLRTTEPYSALATALSDLCDLILASTNDKDQTRAFFQRLHVMPRLQQLIENKGGADCCDETDFDVFDSNSIVTATTASTTTAGTPTSGGTLVGSSRTAGINKHIFKAFLRSICVVSKQPVVFVLDDLQWADVASLDLIASIASDSSSKNLLFLGSYRDNEINADHRLGVFLRKLRKTTLLRQIQVGNFSVDTVNELLSDLTNLEPSVTLPLTRVVHSRTSGNIFFVLEFLRVLQQQGFLFYSMTKFAWTWDMDAIQNETESTDNVVEMVAIKIRGLPEKAQSILKLAACLWSTFDVNVLQEIIQQGKKKRAKKRGDSEKSFHRGEFYDSILCVGSEELVKWLELLAEEALLDRLVAGERYKFAHDRIQQAAYTLIPEGQTRDLVHVWIGKILLNMMTVSSVTRDWLLFVTADQLNHGRRYITDEKKQTDVARLNLQVGEKAASLSAFVPAAAYYKSGIEILPKRTRWERQHYLLCLKLHNSLAEMEHCNGRIKETENTVNDVLDNARSLQDKIKAYHTLGLSWISQAKQKQVIDMCHKILNELNEPVPTEVSKRQLPKEFARIQKEMQGKTDRDILSKHPMEDRVKRNTMMFCDLLHNSRVHLGQMHHASLISVKMMDLYNSHGMDELTPIAFAYWGLSLIGEGDIEEGYRFGKLALKAMEKFKSKRLKARVIPYVHTFLNHWKEPLQKSLDPLLDAHKSNMINGDVTWAFQCLLGYQALYFYGGLPLETGVEDMMAFSKQIIEYKQELVRRAHLPIMQFMLNLMGRSTDPLQLTGEAMNQQEFESHRSNPNQIGVQLVWCCRMQLAYYFGDMDLAAKLSDNLQNLPSDSVFVANYVLCTRKMFFGLISIELARKTKSRKHTKNAQKILNDMEKKWVKRGAVNCLHKLLLLKAEYASLKSKDRPEIKKAYDTAITTTRRIGFIQDEALANERAGLFFLRGGEAFWASSYLSRAWELYSEWGAEAKADLLLKQHGNLLTPSEVKMHSSSVRGRARFSESESTSKPQKRLSFSQLLG